MHYLMLLWLLTHEMFTPANKAELEKLIEKAAKGITLFTCVSDLFFLSTSRLCDTSPNPKSKLAPHCGNLIQFPLFGEGQTQATPSLLIAYEAIKSHRGLSFSAQRVAT